MRRVCFTSLTLCAALAALAASPAFAQVTSSGDVSPDPSTWTSSTTAYVGYTTANGLVTVNNGYTLSSGTSYLGYTTGLTGTVNVDGSGSSWTPNTWLYDGYQGTGLINVTNGGLLNANCVGYVGSLIGGTSASVSTGTLNIDGSGSTVDTAPNFYVGYCSGATGTATGTMNITNGGSFANVNPVGSFYAGFNSTGTTGTARGTINISNGTLNTTLTSAYLGFTNGSVGTVNISGPNSTWLPNSQIYLGYNVNATPSGVGVLNMTNGGTIPSDGGAYYTLNIGDNDSTSASIVNIDGPSSGIINTNGAYATFEIAAGNVNFTNGATESSAILSTFKKNGNVASSFNVDGSTTNVNLGKGISLGSSDGTEHLTMNVSGGAQVPAAGRTLTVYPNSTLSVDVGTGSLIALGTGRVTNNTGATVRFVAGAGAGNGTSAPITGTGAWTGSGAYQGVGCVWNGTTAKTVTVNSAVTASGPGGASDSLNTSTNQRMLISDSTAGTSVGVGFLSTEGAVSLTAATASTSSLVVPAGLPVLDAWAFSGLSGVGASDPAYLSLSLPASYSTAFLRTNLSVWKNSGSGWGQITPNDLTFNAASDYASFTVTGSSALGGVSYAISSTAILPGDANIDGRVDINDLTTVLTSYNQTGQSWSTGDFIGDGTVDINDLTIVLTNYNTSVGASAAGIGGAVPEPGVLALVAAGLVGLLAYAWRKRK
jgi:T5SS/PEP-CTERM-associated repeat protein